PEFDTRASADDRDQLCINTIRMLSIERHPFWRVGPGTHRHARVRLHTRAHRRDGESGTETDRRLVRTPMPKPFKRGDLVEWNSEAGRVRGVIVKKLVSNIRLKGYVHHASNAEPQYVIKSVKTDHVAIHKGQALTMAED